MKRRTLIAALGGTAVSRRLAYAQAPTRMVRVGMLLNAKAALGVDAFVAEMGRLGYAEGRNLVLDSRLVNTAERNAALASESVAGHPDVLVGAGTQQVVALQGTAGPIPIVFANTGDPVGAGLVKSLARPGGNTTGIANLIPQLAGKRLELIGEVNPGARRIAMLFNPTNPLTVSILHETEAAAGPRGITVIPAPVRSPAELPGALQRIVDDKAAALIGAGDVMIGAHTASIIVFAAQQKLPTIFPDQQDARAGGLMSYGINPSESYRRAAQLVDKILKGTKPADLPVEQPTTFKLIINLKTAASLALTIPSSLLARADELIE